MRGRIVILRSIAGHELVLRWQYSASNAHMVTRTGKIAVDRLPAGTPVAQRRPGEFVAWEPGMHCSGLVLASRNGYASILVGSATVDRSKITAQLSKEALAALRDLGIEISEALAKKAGG